MSIGFDPAAFILALLVCLVTLSQYRRTFQAMIRIVDASIFNSFTSVDDNKQLYFQFQLFLRNTGRTLHDVSVILSFRSHDGLEWLQIPLRKISPTNPHEDKFVHDGEYLQGMTAIFGLVSYRMHSYNRELLAMLEDPVRQKACFDVFSQGFHAKRIKVGTGWDLFRRRWNEVGWRINPQFDKFGFKRITNIPYVKHRQVVPILPCLWHAVIDLLKENRSLDARTKSISEITSRSEVM